MHPTPQQLASSRSASTGVPIWPIMRDLRRRQERSTTGTARADDFSPQPLSSMEKYAMTIPADLLTAARAKALFTSDLSTYSHPTRAEVAAAIRNAVRTYGGTRCCTVEAGGEYGEHPETAMPRMRWALGVVHTVYMRHGATDDAITPL